MIDCHPAQADYCDSPARFRGFVGGRGSGKTWCGAFDLLCRAREKPGRTYLVASPTSVVMGDTTFPTFKALAEDLGVWRSAKLTPYPNVTIAAEGGLATVRFRTAEDPERMRGPNLSGVWLDEASLMPEDAFTISIAALREAGEFGWLGATFTPKGPLHWTYERFGTKKPDTAIFHARTGDNPFNPPDFESTLAKQYSPMFARQELGGEFVEMAGAEWPAAWFPESMWFTDWPGDGLTLRVIALDPSKGRGEGGDYSAFVCLARDRDRRMWVEAHMANHWPTTEIVTEGLALADRFQRETRGPLDGFGVESDQFQEMLATEFVRHARASGRRLPLYKMPTRGRPKEVRIRTWLTPDLSAGLFRFRDTPATRLLVKQLRMFPVGDFDDGPDSMSYARELASTLWNGRAGRMGPNPPPPGGRRR